MIALCGLCACVRIFRSFFACYLLNGGFRACGVVVKRKKPRAVCYRTRNTAFQSDEEILILCRKSYAQLSWIRLIQLINGDTAMKKVQHLYRHNLY